MTQETPTTGERIVELLQEIKDELANEKTTQANLVEDVKADPDAGMYECDECGETFEETWDLGAHVNSKHNSGKTRSAFGSGQHKSISDERAYKMLSTIKELPVDAPTSVMIAPFIDFDATSSLSLLYKNDALDREGDGYHSDPYRYTLTDAAHEFLEDADQ